MRTLSIGTPTHGRVLVEDAADVFSGLIVGFHGYAQSAEDMLDEVRRLPGSSRWRLAAIQALHRFYSRGEQRVVASWMTRQDREQAILDNLAYVDAAVDQIAREPASGGHPVEPAASSSRIVYVGFSQGASMAARAAVRGARRAVGLIMLGGDIPSDVREVHSADWPPVLIGCGDRDAWYGARVESDVAFLQSHGVSHRVVRFDGGHEFTEEFRQAAGMWLERTTTGA